MSRKDTTFDLEILLEQAAAAALRAGCEVQRELLPSPPVVDASAAAARELRAPTGSARLAHLARGRRCVAIVTSDLTRAVPNREVLPPVLSELARAGVERDGIRLVVGGGAHRPVTRHEMRDLIGRKLMTSLDIVAHDAKRSDCVSVGRTPLGNEVRINRIVADADLVIALGVVEVHEFAGFSGGRKAILPGVAAYESILQNHSVALLDCDTARPGILAGNPIHEEMSSAARLAGLEFILNVVLDGDNRVVALAAGDPEAAHGRLVEFVRATQTLSTTPEADIVVTGPGSPLDLNFYQSVKSLIALEPLVQRETTVVLLSACDDGMGSTELAAPFAASTDPDGAMRAAAAAYTVEKDHSYLLARFLARCPQVIACCPGADPDDLRAIGLEVACSPEDAMARAIAHRRQRAPRPRVLLFPRPQRTVPSLPSTTDHPSIPVKGCCR